MKIAVLSDTRLPTSAAYAGHGLGKMALAAAEGLAQRGHEVWLFGGKGTSSKDARIVIVEARDERDYFVHPEIDVVLDGTHAHTLQKTWTKPVVNWSHDREASPGRCAVYPSEAHAWHFRAKLPRIVRNGVDVPDMALPRRENYFAFMSNFMPHKGPLMAWQAARIADVPLKMAGDGYALSGVEYVGPLAGDAKLEFLAKARGFIFSASTESAGITPLEAQSVGCPVLTVTYGGAAESIEQGVTGFIVRDVEELARMMPCVDAIDADVCRQFVRNKRSVHAMVDGLEAALKDAVNGEVW